jgi:ATP-dependent DNA helicase RecG
MNGDKVSVITTEQRNWIIHYEEGQLGDVADKDIAPAKMSRKVSAFANAEGGELWIGIHETEPPKRHRSWRGFKTIEDANAHIQILDSVLQLEQGYSFEFLSHPKSNGFVLHIEIDKMPGIILATNKTAYIRRGSQDEPCDDTMLNQLKRNKGIVSFETNNVNTTPNTIIDSIVTRTFMRNVVPTARAEEWLTKQQTLVNGKPTVAGVILFADEPQSIIPKRSGIKIARYVTSMAGEGTRETLQGNPISIEGCAYNLIQSAVRRTQDIIEGVRKWTEHGVEMVSYPPETLHEIITNAVLHRDYAITDDISVRIFDDRVEVESPGTLSGHITERNILQERFSRNPIIVRLINKFPNPPNKDIGEGLRTAFAAMQKMRLRPPEIHQSEHSVIVYIRHTSLESPEDTVMVYLKEHQQINNSKARELTGIRSENTMKGVFDRLAKKNLIERVPNTQGRNSAWRVKSEIKNPPISKMGIDTEPISRRLPGF